MNKGPEQFRKELVEICTKGRFYSTGGGTAQFVRNLIVHVCKKMDKNDAKAMELLNRCTQVVGVFEGAGYQTKGCYRPAQECRMKINEVEDFCPVCNRAIRRITDFYTSK